MELIILKVGPEAIPVIQHLTGQVWPQTYASLLTTEQIDYMLEQMYSTTALTQQMEEGHQFLLALNEKQPVGFASYSNTSKEKEYKLHKLYVITTKQKTGAGKQLLWEVINRVKVEGGQQLILQVNRENKNAIDFYLRMGFHKEREADFDIGNGFFMNDYVLKMEF
jgi:ribosomal protein S18 acetylase RimI-like enzyme